MNDGFILSSLILYGLLSILLFVLPLLWVLLSKRSHGGAKFGWFLIALFFSWIGLAAFLIFTQATRDRNPADYDPC